MLQVASYKISDADGINALLQKYRLAEGAHILISDGQVCIPYNDGEPKSKEQSIVDTKEQINTMLTQIELIEHSNKVLNFLATDANKRVDDAVDEVRKAQEAHDALGKKEREQKKTADAINEANKKVNGAKAGLNELQNQVRMNEHELLRLRINIDMLRECIVGM